MWKIFMKKRYVDQYEYKTFNIGKIRATVHFSSGKTCDITVIGQLTSISSRKNTKGEYETTEYHVMTANDKFEDLIDSLDGSCRYLVSDGGTIYNLDNNEVDYLQIMENGDLDMNMKLYLGKEVVYEQN